jgi:hypothetical protein
VWYSTGEVGAIKNFKDSSKFSLQALADMGGMWYIINSLPEKGYGYCTGIYGMDIKLGGSGDGNGIFYETG